MLSFSMFYVDLISDKIWHQIVDNVINLELETLDISYVLISKKKNNNEVVGFIKYDYTGQHDIYDTIKSIIVIKERLKIWKECNFFRQLRDIHNIFYSIATIDSTMTCEKHAKPDTKTLFKNIQIPSIIGQITSELFHTGESPSMMVLVIEERTEGLTNEFGPSCKVKQNKTVLSLLTRRQLHKVHIIHPCANQCYHSFNFHHNPHYNMQKSLLPLFRLILEINLVNFEEYLDNDPFQSNDFITVYNNSFNYDFGPRDLFQVLKSYKLKSRNISNFYVSYGFSAEYRSITGEPLLTTGIRNTKSSENDILQHILPILSYLSQNIMVHYPHIAKCETRNHKYSQKLGSNFNFSMTDINIYEGFDVAVNYSKSPVEPHCDVMNDWRYGYNFISVMKSSFYEVCSQDIVTISVICYTRKAIGDHIDRMRRITKQNMINNI